MSVSSQNVIKYVIRIEKSLEWSWQYVISVTAHLNAAQSLKDKEPAKPLPSWDPLATLHSGNRDLMLEAMTEYFQKKGASFVVSSPTSLMILTYIEKDDEMESSDDVSEQDSDMIGDEDEGEGDSEEDDDNKTRIGSIHGTIIWRGGIRKRFWTEMEEPSQDLSALGFDVFTR